MKTLTLPPIITKEQLDTVLPQHSDHHKEWQLYLSSSGKNVCISYRHDPIYLHGSGLTVTDVQEPHESTPGRFRGLVGQSPVITCFDFHIRTVLDHFYPGWCK